MTKPTSVKMGVKQNMRAIFIDAPEPASKYLTFQVLISRQG